MANHGNNNAIYSSPCNFKTKGMIGCSVWADGRVEMVGVLQGVGNANIRARTRFQAGVEKDLSSCLHLTPCFKNAQIILSKNNSHPKFIPSFPSLVA